MKVHEHSVLQYCHGHSPVDKEGYLQKKGEVNTSYQRRWFVLKGNLLFYFERRSDRDPLGLIVLEGCSVELCESDEEFAFALVYKDPSLRMYKMAAENQPALESWIKVLLAASYEYLRVLVSDLQRQYEELYPAANNTSFQRNTLPDLLSPNACLWVPGSGPGGMVQETNRNNSVSGMGTQTKHPKRSPKMWAKRVHPAPARPEAPRGTLGEATMPAAAAAEVAVADPWEDFHQIHFLYGEEVLLLRRAWREKQRQQCGTKAPGGEEEDLIDFE